MKNANVDLTKGTASTVTAITTSQPLKSGAKRKLNVSDDDDQPATLDEPGKQDSQYNGRSSDLRTNDNDNTKPILARANKAANDKAPQAAIPGISGNECKEKASGASATVTVFGRKALGPSKCCEKSRIGETLTMMQRV